MPLSFADHLVGIVRVPIANLRLALPGADHLGRSEKSGDVLRLVHVFQEAGFHPSESINQISGVISPKGLRSLLSSARLSRESLLQTVVGTDFPFVAGSFEILCAEGRRRIEAARMFLGSDAWWTIKLHCVGDTTSINDAAFQHQHTFISPEAPYADGEVYHAIRYHQKRGDDQSIRAWKIRLSNCKARALNHLIARPDICHALDRIMVFPGLRSGLQLGNIDKNLATHCDELIIHYFEHIYQIWSTILADTETHPLLDDDTVRLLQFRAPLASQDDRDFISQSMSSGFLFRYIIRSEDRARLQHSILAFNGVIPTLTTFHQNMKFIAIGASIIKKHLDTAQPKVPRISKRTTTLFTRLERIWVPPEQPLLEVSEGRFRLLAGESSFHLSCTQLFISVLRRFSQLSNHATLRDRKSDATFAQLDHMYLDLLFRRAIALGFKTDAIHTQRSQVRAVAPRTPSSPQDLEPTISTCLADWRGGKPFASTLVALHECCFLPSLARSKVRTAFLTPSFVQLDFVTAFFGSPQFAIDETQSMEYQIELEADTVQQNVARVENPPNPEPTSKNKVERKKKRNNAGRRVLQSRIIQRKVERGKNNKRPGHRVAQSHIIKRKASRPQYAHLFQDTFVHTLAQRKLDLPPEVPVMPLVAERNEIRPVLQTKFLVDRDADKQGPLRDQHQEDSSQERLQQDDTNPSENFDHLPSRDLNAVRSPLPMLQQPEPSNEPPILPQGEPTDDADMLTESEDSDSSSDFILSEANQLYQNAEIGKTESTREEQIATKLQPSKRPRDSDDDSGPGKPSRKRQRRDTRVDTRHDDQATNRFVEVPLSPDPRTTGTNPHFTMPTLSTLQSSMPRKPLQLPVPEDLEYSSEEQL